MAMRGGQDSRHGRSDEMEGKNQHSRRAVIEVEWKSKKDSTESQAQGDVHNAVSAKDTEKFMTKRRSNPGSIDKKLDDGINPDDKRVSSWDDHMRFGAMERRLKQEFAQQIDDFTNRMMKMLHNHRARRSGSGRGESTEDDTRYFARNYGIKINHHREDDFLFRFPRVQTIKRMEEDRGLEHPIGGEDDEKHSPQQRKPRFPKGRKSTVEDRLGFTDGYDGDLNV